MEAIQTSEDKYEQIILFILTFTRDNGVNPSMREICTGTGINSTATLSKHLRRMRDAGLIEYEPGKARSIKLRDRQQ